MRYGLAIVMAVTTGVLSVSSSGESAGPGLVTDINANGLGFGQTDVFDGNTYAANDAATDGTNEVLAFSAVGRSGFDVAGLVVPVSNGENGDAVPSNATAPDPAFAAVGNASGRLENGNVIRFSAWVRADPSDPITKEPGIEPVFKLEFWQTAGGSNADFAGGANPQFGDLITDTELYGSAIADPAQRARFLDLNGDGDTTFNNPVTLTVVPDEWRLVEHTYTVDDTSWAIGAVPKTVADVEEIRSLMVVGDVFGADLSDGGTFWVDNALVEVFADAASVTPNTNPNPDIPEPGALALLTALGWCRGRRVESVS